METTKIQQIKELCDKRSTLVDETGAVFVWRTDDNLSCFTPTRFNNEENAKEYIKLSEQIAYLYGVKNAYIIGSEKDHQNAECSALRKMRADSVKAYAAHVDKIVKAKKYEINALKAFHEVCKKFDGKVINKRFTDAASEATGFYCTFDLYEEYSINLLYRGRDFASDMEPKVHIYGSKTLDRNGADIPFWRWTVNDRLEACKVDAIIAAHINERKKRIDELTATKKQYSAYLKLAEKAAKLVRELNTYNSTLQDFARKHDTATGVGAANVWRY